MKKEEIILVPGPGIGHLVSAIEFAKILLNHDDRIIVTVLVLKMRWLPVLDSYTESVTLSQPRIQLIVLPTVDLPSEELLKQAVETYIYAFVENYIPHIKAVVSDIVSSRSNSESVRVAGLFLDFFCVSAIDIGKELCLPTYIFLTSGAGFLNLMLFVPVRDEKIGKGFDHSDPEFLLPGFVNPVSPRVLPLGLVDNDSGYATYVKLGQRFRDVKGIVVNTFDELESYAIDSTKHCQAPPVYPVGPVLNLKGQPHQEFDQARWDEIAKWLDKQPQSSVLFLCFGSYGSFSTHQVEEMALALERSGCRFLWSLRAPSSGDESHFENAQYMLPKGFLERIGERGMVCGWALQVKVLDHDAIGGFVSHCGWNSILESLWYGVPTVTLPIYAEQQLNAFTIAKELGLAVELRLDYNKDHLVMADEIERAVRSVMESDNEVRKKVREMKEIARKAVIKGGSSYTSIAKLFKDITLSN